MRIELQTALAAYERRAAAARVLETEALPGLDDTDALTTRSFDVGQIGLPDVLLIRRELLDTRFQYLSSLSRGRAGPSRGGRRRGSTAMTMISETSSLEPGALVAAQRRWQPRGCRLRRRPGASGASGRGRGPAAAATPAQHADGGEVRIEAGMLRDLRLTTAQVESRPGGEQVTLLGELAVDERSYAEVGAPVAARVVRLMAGVGDRVRAGQAVARAAVAGGRTRQIRLPGRGRPADPGREQPEAEA